MGYFIHICGEIFYGAQSNLEFFFKVDLTCKKTF